MLNLQGTYRERTPEQTLALLSDKLYENYGITRLANITGLDDLSIPVHIAIRPNSKSLSVAQGKGLTHNLAKVSALMESIEVWYAENIKDDAVIQKGIYNSESAMLDPKLFSSTVSNNHTFEWIKVINLIDDQTYLLPKSLYSLDTTQENQIFDVSSNGLASGNTEDEAVIHSLCELVERDATSKWYDKPEAKQDKCLLKLETVKNSTLLGLINQIIDKGLKLYVWDITTINDIPAYYCALLEDNGLPYTLFTGQGAHFDSDVALCRAITEACQARLTFISGSRDDIFPGFYEEYEISENFVKQLNCLEPIVPYKKISMGEKHMGDIKSKLIQSLSTAGVKSLYMYQHCNDAIKAVVHIKSTCLQEVEK